MERVKIAEVREIPLTSLVIGRGQVRVRDVGTDIDQLAASIAKVGQLEPIVVCPSKEEGKYEILTGQRRFLALKQLKKFTIQACILERQVDEIDAKIISLTENLVRRDLNRKDLIDACTALFKRYNSIKDVADETGLPYNQVREYVKYDRLRPELKKMVDDGKVDIKVALRAQDASSVTGEYKPEEAVELATEMSRMSGVQQERVVSRMKNEPNADATEIIEEAKTGDKITQIVVTIGVQLHQSIKRFAMEGKMSVDDAARELLESALVNKGYIMGE